MKSKEACHPGAMTAKLGRRSWGEVDGEVGEVECKKESEKRNLASEISSAIELANRLHHE